MRSQASRVATSVRLLQRPFGEIERVCTSASRNSARTSIRLRRSARSGLLVVNGLPAVTTEVVAYGRESLVIDPT